MNLRDPTSERRRNGVNDLVVSQRFGACDRVGANRRGGVAGAGHQRIRDIADVDRLLQVAARPYHRYYPRPPDEADEAVNVSVPPTAVDHRRPKNRRRNAALKDKGFGSQPHLSAVGVESGQNGRRAYPNRAPDLGLLGGGDNPRGMAETERGDT